MPLAAYRCKHCIKDVCCGMNRLKLIYMWLIAAITVYKSLTQQMVSSLRLGVLLVLVQDSSLLLPTGIAVDLKTGDVYMSDTGNNRIDKVSVLVMMIMMIAAIVLAAGHSPN